MFLFSIGRGAMSKVHATCDLVARKVASIPCGNTTIRECFVYEISIYIGYSDLSISN